MRPSSGGSSLISNWLDPACARATMAIGRPEIETAAGAAPGAPVAVWGVAALAATMPKLGRLAVADCTALVAVCAFDGPEPSVGAAAAEATAPAALRSAVSFAPASPCGGAAPAAGAGWAKELPDVGAALVPAGAAGFAAAASVGAALASDSGCCAVCATVEESWPPPRDKLARARGCSPIATLAAAAAWAGAVVSVKTVAGTMTAATGDDGSATAAGAAAAAVPLAGTPPLSA